MFNDEYPYKSSESKTMKLSFKNLTNKIKKNFKPKFIIEIASNDGIFLKNFSKDSIVGVEPCENLAKLTLLAELELFLTLILNFVKY